MWSQVPGAANQGLCAPWRGAGSLPDTLLPACRPGVPGLRAPSLDPALPQPRFLQGSFKPVSSRPMLSFRRSSATTREGPPGPLHLPWASGALVPSRPPGRLATGTPEPQQSKDALTCNHLGRSVQL